MRLTETDQPQSQYLSYLMRLWRPTAASQWHILLEHVGTGEKLGFADLEALFSFLQDSTGQTLTRRSGPGGTVSDTAQRK